ncbi:MAG: DUF21 domain-containing protein, partial [Oscillospiraceae bacterium]|nr:DUF21 domain-containing protein [Oscillospiraceae bacterium]
MSSDPLGPQLFLQFVLILVNAFFASAEMAVISLNENRIRRAAEEGDEKAKQMLKLLENPAKFLSAIQVVITLAGFLASAFAADNFSGRLTATLVRVIPSAVLSEAAIKTISLVAITLILSYFTLVFGELVPKRVAMQYPERVARMSSGVIRAVNILFMPLIWLFSTSTNGILRLLHINPNAQGNDVSEDEIRLLVDIGEEKGAIESNEKVMIENVFAFNNMSA